jgi:aspartate/glutamate racemase
MKKMGKGFFQKGLAKHGIETITPDFDDQNKINKIIYSELIRLSEAIRT